MKSAQHALFSRYDGRYKFCLFHRLEAAIAMSRQEDMMCLSEEKLGIVSCSAL
jgi:hypothetical protein